MKGSSKLARLFDALALMGELGAFIRARKVYWLAPLIAVLILLGLLFALPHNPVLAPILYVLF